MAADQVLDAERIDRAVEIAREARERAYAPYSGFRMGAAVITHGDAILPGSLVENISLGLAMCAERAALFSCVSQDAGPPRALVLVAPRTSGQITRPCGACLQVALELGGPELIVIASDIHGAREQASLGALAPHLPYKPESASRRVASSFKRSISETKSQR